jgi:Transposase IS116/IS110/IS902 family
MADIIVGLYEDWLWLDERIESLSSEIKKISKSESNCGRLMSVPGIGPMISTATVAAIGTGEAFERGRDLGAFGLASVLSQPVQAQALDIDQPEITKGEREVRSVNVANGGFPAGSGGMPRTSHELSTSYSPTGWMKLGAHFDIENVIDEGWRLDHGAIELQFELLTAEASGGIALGWTTKVQISTDDASTNSLIFGPIVKFSSKAASSEISITVLPQEKELRSGQRRRTKTEERQCLPSQIDGECSPDQRELALVAV